jgi:hypothetical protein
MWIEQNPHILNAFTKIFRQEIWGNQLRSLPNQEKTPIKTQKTSSACFSCSSKQKPTRKESDIPAISHQIVENKS